MRTYCVVLASQRCVAARLGALQSFFHGLLAGVDGLKLFVDDVGQLRILGRDAGSCIVVMRGDEDSLGAGGSYPILHTQYWHCAVS